MCAKSFILDQFRCIEMLTAWIGGLHGPSHSFVVSLLLNCGGKKIVMHFLSYREKLGLLVLLVLIVMRISISNFPRCLCVCQFIVDLVGIWGYDCSLLA